MVNIILNNIILNNIILNNIILNNNGIKLNILTHKIKNPKAVLIHIHGLFQNFQNEESDIKTESEESDIKTESEESDIKTESEESEESDIKTESESDTISFKNKIQKLEKLNIVSYAIELRGHGLSHSINICDITLDDYVSDLHTLVTYIHMHENHGNLPIHIMANSMGGAIAIKYCLKYNNNITQIHDCKQSCITQIHDCKQSCITSIILLSPLIGISDIISISLNIFKKININDPFINLYINILKIYFIKYNNYLSKYDNMNIVTIVKELLSSLDYINNNINNFTTPILVMHSKDDKITCSKKSENFISLCNSNDKKIILFDGSEHNLFITMNPMVSTETIFNNICEWLKKYIN